jgi:protein O-GlcNAc transferase
MKPRGTSGKREALLADAARAESGGDLAGAALILERILRSEPMHANALRSLAAIRLREGRAADAEPILRRLLARHPKDPGGLVNLGIALRMLGRFDEARVPLETAVDSPAAPVEAFDALGSLQAAGGDHESAAATFRRAVEAHPSVAATWSNLGLALLRNAGAKDGSARAERYDEAVDACRRAIELDPSEASAWNNLGSIERDRGRAGDAASAYRRAIEAAPRAAEARTNLAGVLRESGHLAEALASAESAVVRAPGRAVLHSNLLYAMNFADSIPEERIFEAHAAFGRRFGTGEVFSEGERRARLRELFAAGRPVRIGFVSPDFRRHSVASFIEPLLASLDRDRFECFAYSDVAREDDTTRRLRGLVPHWRPIHGYRDDQVADEIADDSIEILVDLAGHTAGNRMRVFARRAAPVQVTYLGYPNTTGLPQIDFRIVDAVTDPPGREAFATETLLRMPGCFVCFKPDPIEPPPRATSGPPVFGSFNSMAKITPTTIDSWAAVLLEAPDSRLLLKARGLDDAFVANRIVESFAARGIAVDRLDLRGRIEDPRGHLALYGEIDVALDTFPYHGTTTTCEALAMGVPVISLVGDSHRSRVGASLLAATDPNPPRSSDRFVARAIATLEAERSASERRSRLGDRILEAGPFVRAFGSLLESV